MDTSEDLEPPLSVIWAFVRGDLAARQFEQWACHAPDLEELLGEGLYLDIISANYTSPGAVLDMQNVLRAFAWEAEPLACACRTLPNVADVDMAQTEGSVLQTLQLRAERGEPIWWLSAQQCTVCGQEWLVAREERHNDVYLLKRLAAGTIDLIVQDNRWPGDFERYETLLRLGRQKGHSVRYADPLHSVILRATISELARERPGITIDELADLLGLEPEVARVVARKVANEDGVEIGALGAPDEA